MPAIACSLCANGRGGGDAGIGGGNAAARRWDGAGNCRIVPDGAGDFAEDAHAGCLHTDLRRCMISLGSAFWFDMGLVTRQIARRNELDVNGQTAHRRIIIDAELPQDTAMFGMTLTLACSGAERRGRENRADLAARPRAGASASEYDRTLLYDAVSVVLGARCPRWSGWRLPVLREQHQAVGEAQGRGAHGGAVSLGQVESRYRRSAVLRRDVQRASQLRLAGAPAGAAEGVRTDRGNGDHQRPADSTSNSRRAGRLARRVSAHGVRRGGYRRRSASPPIPATPPTRFRRWCAAADITGVGAVARARRGLGPGGAGPADRPTGDGGAALQATRAMQQVDAAYVDAFKNGMQLLVDSKQLSMQQALGYDIDYSSQVFEAGTGSPRSDPRQRRRLG